MGIASMIIKRFWIW